MSEKKAFKRLLLVIVTGMILVGIFTAVTDPFYHYHKPIAGMPVVLENTVYQTPGAAKSLEYDGAIVGTSMTENFHTSWFDEELGWRTMKLSYSGARTNDLNAILGQVFKNENPPKHIFMDMNDYQLTVESESAFALRPEYLYDEDYLNDYRYLYNHSVFNAGIARCIDALVGAKDNIDSAYTWEDESYFSREAALAAASADKKMIEANRNNPADKQTLSEKLTLCQENLDNVTPYIAENPETEFIIFLPPYSMLYWEEKVLLDDLADMITVYTYAVEKLLEYPNVRMYYFQYEPDIITNLDNYRDTAHHKPIFNRYIFDCIKENKNQLTKENYKEKFQEMYTFAKEYPYGLLWGETQD